ncbi:MAG: hypothetical protein JWQ28_2419 [Pedobacter sp.]|jgi:hypothetical protein|nr:hypothetical protein [Pedobacter sp.]
MKTSKAEAHEKGSKKAAKKELQKNLTAKFFEAVKSLGHDAANIGDDLVLVSKFVAKKIAKRVSSSKKDGTKKGIDVVANGLPVEKKKSIKKAEKAAKKAGKTVVKAVAEEKPLVNTAKVTGLASEEKLAQVISKSAPDSNGKRTKPKPTLLKPSATKISSKKGGTTAE